MAALDKLNEIVDKHATEKTEREAAPKRKNETKPRLMQHAHVAQDDDVRLSGQKRHSYARTGRADQKNQGQKNTAVRTQTQAGKGDRSNADAIDGQTQVIRTQVMASNKQSNLLQQQSGLMQDQLGAMRDVSDVITRLADFMQKQATKPEPKVQDGHTYEGQFSRVNEQEVAAQERRRSIMDDMKERRREKQRDRASRQERDRLGRFKRSAPKGPKLQRVGGALRGGAGALGEMGGLGGRAAGMGAAALGPILALATAYYGGKAMDAMYDNATFEKSEAGSLRKGYQSAGDWMQDKMRPEQGNSYVDQNTRNQGRDVEGKMIGEKSRHQEFGAISANFESGGRGVATVSTGKGDNGGVSYGKHQLSSKEGTMTSYLRSEDGQKYYNDFRGLAPGSKEFDAKYKEVAGRDGDEFDKSQQKFVTKSHYDPLAEWFTKQYGIDLDKRSRALKEALYSVSVQYGVSTGKSVLGDAFGNRDLEGMDDATLIDYIQETRANTVSTRFRSSDKATQESVYKRAGTEKAALLGMLNEEKAGPGSAAKDGSGIGAAYSQKMIGAYGGQPAGGGGSNTGTGAASNGTIGIMAPTSGGGGATTGAGDEAGGGTAAAMLSPGDGALYALGQKNTIPNDNSVNMSGLNAKFKQAFFTMVGDWVQNNSGTQVKVASAFRTRAEQEQLWIKYGRNTKRVARPGTSRHESGFAIDIDRDSAGKMESTGLFKKYGFHRPLSNEPWHVELIGGSKGGGTPPETKATGAAPQLMQQAAVEMDASAKAVATNTAEENTKGAGAAPGGKAITAGGDEAGGGTVAKSGVAGGKEKIEEEEEEEEVDEKPEGPEGENHEIKTEAMPATVNVMGDTPVITQGGVQNPDGTYAKSGANGNPYGTPGSPGTKAGGTWSQRNGQMGQTMGGGYSGSPGTPGYGQRARPYSQTQTGRAVTGAVTKIGNVMGLGSFGTMAPGVDGGLRGIDSKVNGVFNKVPGLRELSRIPGIPQIPRLSSGLPSFGNIVTGAADKIGSFFGGGDPAPTNVPYTERPKIMNGQKVTYDGPAVTSTDQIGKTSLNAPVAAMSPASATYYNNDAPVVTKSAGSMPISPMSAPSQATAMPAPEAVERNSFDGVQKVSIASSDVPQADGGGGAAAGGGGGGGGSAGGAKNDMPQIDDAPAIMDDFGLLFVNMGMV